MNQRKPIILYIFLGLIILGGVLLFFLRSWAFDLISNSSLRGLNDILNTPVRTNAQQALDLSLLQDKRFMNLKNQVVNFDYDNFGQVGSANDVIVTDLEQPRPEEIASTTAGEEVASSSKPAQTVKIRVDIGNNNLFLKKTK
ncbi:MAG: hypothetical protein WC441_00710 [Patescibacteria group bacterium]